MKTIAIDWSHEESKFVVFDGTDSYRKSEKKLDLDGVDKVVTENMPSKYAQPLLEKGIKVLRCATSLTAEIREKEGLEKSDEVDARITWRAYSETPHKFFPFKPDTPLQSAYKTFKEIQTQRVRLSNRAFAGKSVEKVLELQEQQEKELLKMLKKELPEYKIYEWLRQIKGIGPALAAGVIAEIDIQRSDRPSNLRRYAGYGVDKEGRAEKRRKGEKFPCNTRLKQVCYTISDMFIKHRTPIYRDWYDTCKARFMQEGKAKNKLHADFHGRRCAIQLFLLHLHLVWRQMEGLSVAEPYAVAHQGHRFVPPPYWDEENRRVIPTVEVDMLEEAA